MTDRELEWKEKSKEILLNTPIAKINSVESEASDGQKGKYITIDARDWVEVIPVTDNDFIMVKQWRHGEKALSTEFPGGEIADGENPPEAQPRA